MLMALYENRSPHNTMKNKARESPLPTSLASAQHSDPPALNTHIKHGPCHTVSHMLPCKQAWRILCARRRKGRQEVKKKKKKSFSTQGV